MKILKPLSLAVVSALSVHAAQAYESQILYRPDGLAMFETRFFNVGDGPFMGDEAEPSISPWNLSRQQKTDIAAALTYWAELIKPSPGQLPAIVNVGTTSVKGNAHGASAPVVTGQTSLTQMQRALAGVASSPLTFGSHAQFEMGIMDWSTVPYLPSQLPRAENGVDLAAVAFHELAHGLGIAGSIEDRHKKTDPDEEDPPYMPYFLDALDSWAQGLRDDNGNPGRPGQNILCSAPECVNPYDPAAFDVRKDLGYYTAPHVREVLAGAMPGIPVRHYPDGKDFDPGYLAHSELKNSLMSHQEYRNYTNFMEAELALMQDLGYDIDRRNFFGYSVYGSDLQLVNTNGYFQRNAEGTAYIPGQYNTATLGLGLHIYGSRNTVYQQADLLTKGPGGAGVRVDGEANTLVIQPGTRVYADGLNGRGVMFAYGKDHNLVLRGDVQALGELGIGASFDFGNNALSNHSDYRGSYIHEHEGAPAPLLPELAGALVDTVDITGRLAGRSAALYISRNALVNTINVMRGAQIQGDIYSAYNQKDELGRQRLTRLTFGRLPDSLGRASAQPDKDFAWRYDGNIQGIDNLLINTQGGHTSLNGKHEVYGVQVDAGSTLGGNSTYTLNPLGQFINLGTVSPGNSLGTIAVNGDYVQGPGANLLMEMDNQGRHDTLLVSGNVNLDGSLTLAPTAGWYATGLSLRLDNLVQAGSVTGQFSAVNSQLASPTLQARTTRLGALTYQMDFARTPGAYSQYATDRNSRQAGLALDSLGASARPDLQPLYQALDFSAPDGSDIARTLPRLSPQAYSAMVASSLAREHQIADLVAARSLQPAPAGSAAGPWRGFIAPFGASQRQNERDTLLGHNTSTYGLVFGAEHQGARSPDWTLALYGAVSGQSVSVNDSQNASGRSTAFNLGLQARYAPDPHAGLYAFGQAQLGLESGKLTRRVDVNGYSARLRSDWTAPSGSLSAGAGYRWALSPTLSLGPLATLNYTRLQRPGRTESGPDASRLALDSGHLDSLRSRLGLNASLVLPRPSGAQLTAHLQLSWDRELLNRDYVQGAAFVGYPGARLDSRNKVTGRNALGLEAGLSYQLDERLALNATVASQFFQAGQRNISGNLSLTRRF